MSRLTGVSLAIWSAFATLIVVNVMLVTSNLHISESTDVEEEPVRSAHVDQGYRAAKSPIDNNRDRRSSDRQSDENDQRYQRLVAMLEEQEVGYRELLMRYQLLADHLGLEARTPDTFEPIELLPQYLNALTQRPAATPEGDTVSVTETPTVAEAAAAAQTQRIAALEAELQLEMQLNDLLQDELEVLRAAAAVETTDAATEGMTDPMQDTETEIADAVADQLVELGPSAAPALNQLLQHSAPRIREWAANVVTDIGPDAAATRSTLIGLREDADAYVRAAAERALMSIDGQRPE